LLEQAVRLALKAFGPDHPDVARSLNNLAALYQSLGWPAEAEPLYRRCLKIMEAKLGPDHPDVARSLNNLACLQVEQGQWTEAVRTFDRARRTSLRHVVHVLPALAESDQLTFHQATETFKFHGALSLAVAHADDPATAEHSAGWALNGKGLTQQALAQRALLARTAQDPAAAQLVRQLRDVRNALAARTLAIPRPGQEEDGTRALARFRRQFPPNSEREKPCSGPATTLLLTNSAGRQRRGFGRVGVGVGEPCPHPPSHHR
jgi:tetratricopeptide (TPR) repeat protein